MKKRTIELAMAVLLLVGVYLLSREAAKMTMLESSKTVIVLDAGHGGTQLRIGKEYSQNKGKQRKSNRQSKQYYANIYAED